LGYALVTAVLLRLAVGVFWYRTLPVWGHGSPAEKGGYVMIDASERDKSAWKLARSSQPLWSAIGNNRLSDQYGGFLFISASVYRYLGSSTHQPLLIVVLAAAFSSLAVLFTWAFARRAWGEPAAKLSAWGLALYPEAVLLGSSQMREAFTITLTVAAFYGFMRYIHNRSTANLAWLGLPVLLYVPFSPPFAALLVILLAIMAIASWDAQIRSVFKQRRTWLIAGVLATLILMGLWLTLRRFTPPNITNPLAMLGWWLRKSSQLQAFLSKHASGWIQKVFRTTPLWTHLPLLVLYGVVQPFLPAALVATSHSPIWPWIVTWRSTGWMLLLAFLIYATVIAWQRKPERNLARALTLVVWISVLTASLRAGADLWDNPRYRATFAGLQIALAAWAWVEHRRRPDPWLRRAMVGFAVTLFWFLPWYLRRYTAFEWPVSDPFKTLGLGLATAFLFSLWDWTKFEKKPVLPPNSNRAGEGNESGERV
jgi:hypothetical protein